MPANDREMPPMTGKCYPLLEVVDFKQKLMKNQELVKTAKMAKTNDREMPANDREMPGG